MRDIQARLFYSLALYVREAPNYQEKMKIHTAITIILLTQMHAMPEKGENGIAPPIIIPQPLQYRPDGWDINYTSMVEEADFIIVGDVTRIHQTGYVYVTIDIEEYVTNPQNYTQITLSVKNIVLYIGNSSFSHGDLFDVGEKVLVFVEKHGPRYWVHEGEAGKYLVLEERPSYVNTTDIIVNRWRTAPGWKPRVAVYSVARSTGSGGAERAYPLYFTQILFAVLLIPLLFLFLKRRKKLI